MSLEPARILVVDDDEDMRETLATRLRAAGFDVRQAQDGGEALERLREAPTDLVLLDVKMPRADGFEVLERIRREPDPPHVIFLSGQGQLQDRLRGLYGGAVDYITKPFAAEELVARVVAAARRKREVSAAQMAATSDELTGLLNRRGFGRALAEEVARARREGRRLALVYLDADGLKEINDTAGHAAGDELLRAIARALRHSQGAMDRTARIGGDEFAALLPGAGAVEAAEFLTVVSAALSREAIDVCGEPRRPSASSGVAVLPDDAQDEHSLVVTADEALYRAKAARTA